MMKAITGRLSIIIIFSGSIILGLLVSHAAFRSAKFIFESDEIANPKISSFLATNSYLLFFIYFIYMLIWFKAANCLKKGKRSQSILLLAIPIISSILLLFSLSFEVAFELNSNLDQTIQPHSNISN